MMVSLVGAGPGDKGLLTLKGAERISAADTVLYDRFVSADVLAMIPASAEKINVGKTAGSHPIPQEEINQLLLEKAQQGLNVVRLKGGDPFVFGRGGEELKLLAENNIPFEVIPGITSAIAGAAYAGIPITHREYASSFHVITGHGKNNENPNIDYEALVRTKGTLVFMMGVGAIEDICLGCIAGGINKGMPAAIVQNATTGMQRKFVGTVETLPQIARENNVESPAVIIIGNVCVLSGNYDWFSKKPLLGKEIIVARAKPGVSKLSNSLRELGCHVIEMPPAKIIPDTSPGCYLEKAVADIDSYKWLVFTSSTGVAVFFDYLIEIGFDFRLLHHLKIACVGTETEKELGLRGIKAAFCPQEYNGAALAEGLISLVENSDRLLIARAKDGAEDLTRILADSNIAFDDIAIYKQWRSPGMIEGINTNIAAFTSSSSVEWFVQSVSNTNINAICIGGRTAKAAKSYGMTVHISAEATVNSMVNKIMELYAHE